MSEITEMLDVLKEKIMHGLSVCLIIAVVILLAVAVWNMIVYYLTNSRIDSAKQIYNAIRLNEPRDKALSLLRGYNGGTEQYIEEAILPDGKHEVALCLLFGFGRGRAGEIRLTYIDDRLIEKRQNGIW
ncbi:MAG: hypothetical protein IJU66_02325 [Oscillospiraceae bacterium]|nr:hypothetical protein [Oscillospiraceae bacterium]